VSVKGRAGGFAGGFAWSRADEREVRWYDGEGRLVQIARWDEEPVPLTSEWRRRMARSVEQSFRSRGADETSLPGRLAELDEEFDRHEGPLPYWDAFHVDRQGNAWLREYAIPGEPSPRWRVITRDGTFVGWIVVPDIVSILDITDDRVLAVRQDDLDVPAVVMFQFNYSNASARRASRRTRSAPISFSRVARRARRRTSRIVPIGQEHEWALRSVCWAAYRAHEHFRAACWSAAV
jgi:hypothetical protein